MEERIYTIDRVRFEGKWVEYWFVEKPLEGRMSFDACSKGYMLWNAIDKAGIYDEVVSNGLKGRKMKWVKNENSYVFEPKEFVMDVSCFCNQD